MSEVSGFIKYLLSIVDENGFISLTKYQENQLYEVNVLMYGIIKEDIEYTDPYDDTNDYSYSKGTFVICNPNDDINNETVTLMGTKNRLSVDIIDFFETKEELIKYLEG